MFYKNSCAASGKNGTATLFFVCGGYRARSGSSLASNSASQLVPLLLLGTIYAIRHRWIEVKALGGYRFSATQTKAILTFLDAAQCGSNATEFDGPTPCNLLCHRLTLQRVHT